MHRPQQRTLCFSFSLRSSKLGLRGCCSQATCLSFRKRKRSTPLLLQFLPTEILALALEVRDRDGEDEEDEEAGDGEGDPGGGERVGEGRGRAGGRRQRSEED